MTINEKALKLHEEWKGKLEISSKTPVKTREDLAIAYTPGVAEPCKKIAENEEEVYRYTMKGNTIAVVSDGSFRPCRRGVPSDTQSLWLPVGGF